MQRYELNSNSLTDFINSELFMIYIQTHPKVVHIYSNDPDAINVENKDHEDFIYCFADP